MTTNLTLLPALPATRTQQGLCTCCDPPRPVEREVELVERNYGTHAEPQIELVPNWDSHEEFAHDDDDTFAHTAHIHIDTSARDCDSTYDRSTVIRFTNFTTPPSGPTALWRQVAEGSLPLGLCDCGVATIEIGSNFARWSRATDEGGEGGEMRLCTDPSCAHEEHTYRDHTAERERY